MTLLGEARRLRGSVPLILTLAVCGCQPPYEEALIIGHRGSPAQAPENSLEGFDIAYQNGADGVELDVQWSADERNVVFHDDILDRTTECTGFVRSRTLQELRGCPLANGEPLSSLEEVLAALSGKFQVVYVEVKVAEILPPDAEVLAQADNAIDAVLDSGYADRIVIISYDETVLRRLASRQSEGVIGGWDQMDEEAIANAARYDLPWVLMPARTVEPWMRDVIEGLDKQLAIYQVTTPTEVERSLDAGARALMTDDVPVMAAMLGRKRRAP